MKLTRITRHSKQWWNNECKQAINKYRALRSLESWKRFKKVIKNTKRLFFDSKIREVANKSCGPWELMNWVNKRKLPTTKAIKYEGNPCITTKRLWKALHYQIDEEVLNEIGSKPTSIWVSFSKEEFRQALIKCNNFIALGPDKLMWYHLKTILKQDICLVHIINIIDTCINIGHWLSHFKQFSTVIIPKLNKQAYNNPKSFRPIVLLNTLGKLIKKVIADRLQFHVIKNEFIHPSQLGGLKFKSTSDAEVTLTYVICSGWVKKRTTSILAFNIAQFFPSLNHYLFTFSLKKVGFDSRVTLFFVDFLVQRKTNYWWNKFSFSIYEVNVEVGQGSALSSILSILYLLPLLYILEKRLKILNILVSLISFINDSLFISQNKFIDISNLQLFYSYNVLLGLLKKFGLSIEHLKTEMFHFNRSYRTFNPPPLDLLPLGGPILYPKSTWKYLGFIFGQKLAFH